MRLTIYNVRGQRIRVLVDAPQLTGMHRAVWDGKDAFGHTVSAGIYVYRLQLEGSVLSRKMLVLL